MTSPDMAVKVATADTYLSSWRTVKARFARKCSDDLAARADVLRAASVLTVRDYREIFRAMAHAVRDEPTHRLPVRSAYLHGARDLKLTDVPSIARRYQEIEGGPVVEIPGASHCAHWEATEHFNTALWDLVSQ